MLENESFRHFLHVRKRAVFQKFVAVVFTSDLDSRFSNEIPVPPNDRTPTDIITDLLNIGFIGSKLSAEVSRFLVPAGV